MVARHKNLLRYLELNTSWNHGYIPVATNSGKKVDNLLAKKSLLASQLQSEQLNSIYSFIKITYFILEIEMFRVKSKQY